MSALACVGLGLSRTRRSHALDQSTRPRSGGDHRCRGTKLALVGLDPQHLAASFHQFEGPGVVFEDNALASQVLRLAAEGVAGAHTDGIRIEQNSRSGLEIDRWDYGSSVLWGENFKLGAVAARSCGASLYAFPPLGCTVDVASATGCEADVKTAVASEPRIKINTVHLHLPFGLAPAGNVDGGPSRHETSSGM